jgi:hypothetical protein
MTATARVALAGPGGSGDHEADGPERSGGQGAEEILDEVAACGRRISDSGH